MSRGQQAPHRALACSLPLAVKLWRRVGCSRDRVASSAQRAVLAMTPESQAASQQHLNALSVEDAWCSLLPDGAGIKLLNCFI